MERDNQRYIVILAGVATAILVVGTLLRPGPLPDEPRPPAPSQAELSRLAHLAQRRSLVRMTEYFATVADEADRTVTRLPMLNRSGVVWTPGKLVSTRLEPRSAAATTIAGDGGDLGAALTSGGPHLPIAVWRVPESDAFIPAPRRDIAQIEPGTWTVFVFERDQPGFTPATYLETSSVACGARPVAEVVTSVALTAELAGAGLFDLDGELLALVLACDDRLAAVPVAEVDRLIAESETLRSRIVQRFGLGLDDLSTEERAHLGVSFGVLVRDVWADGAAAAIGLLPGDVLVAIDAEPIRAVDRLGPMVAAGPTRAYDIGIIRQDEVLVLQLPSDPAVVAHADDARGGVVWDDPSDGYRIDTVRPGSAAAAAGLRSGDRLLRIDGEAPDDLEAVRAILSPDRDVSVLLELERGTRRWAVLLP